MTEDRKHWKSLLPIIQAYVDGKEIEFRTSRSDTWSPCTGYDFRCDPSQYRIKPEPTYRPFASAEEFAPHRDRWFKVMRISDSGFTRFADYDDAGIVTTSGVRQTWEELFKNFTFDDGTPCGIVERVIRRPTT